MKEITLTQGKVALADDIDYVTLSKFKWFARYCRGNFYAGRNGPPDSNGKRNMIHMHRVIAKTPGDMVTDHINGNTLDNRKSNLRVTTHRNNNQNTVRHRQGGLPGVSWNKHDRRWRATIQVNGCMKYLGNYTDKFEAYNTYVNAIGATSTEI